MGAIVRKESSRGVMVSCSLTVSSVRPGAQEKRASKSARVRGEDIEKEVRRGHAPQGEQKEEEEEEEEDDEEAEIDEEEEAEAEAEEEGQEEGADDDDDEEEEDAK